MARIKRAWYYQRKAQEAERREQFLRNRVPNPNPTYRARPDTSRGAYGSISQTNSGQSTTSQFFIVQYPEIAGLERVMLGLRDVTAHASAANIRKSPIYPTRASWYEGSATPQIKQTAWQTRWIQYYSAGNNKHASAPISAADGSRVLAADQIATFRALFPIGAENALLGAKNGRAHLTLERIRGLSIIN